MRLYKVLNLNGTACHGGTGKWNLPQGKRPGRWMPKLVDIAACKRGYHLCREQDLIHWIGPAIFEAEGRGEFIACDDKLVFPQARLLRRLVSWNERTARLIAADCAEHVLPVFERKRPNDDRPRKAIQAARDFANGKIDDAAYAAAYVAARAAARDAAYDDAYDDETKWQTARLFEYVEGKA